MLSPSLVIVSIASALVFGNSNFYFKFGFLAVINAAAVEYSAWRRRGAAAAVWHANGLCLCWLAWLPGVTLGINMELLCHYSRMLNTTSAFIGWISGIPVASACCCGEGRAVPGIIDAADWLRRRHWMVASVGLRAIRL